MCPVFIAASKAVSFCGINRTELNGVGEGGGGARREKEGMYSSQEPTGILAKTLAGYT